jgi:hypothetical protein
VTHREDRVIDAVSVSVIDRGADRRGRRGSHADTADADLVAGVEAVARSRA